jgi:beta-1,4-mannosyltransferase
MFTTQHKKDEGNPYTLMLMQSMPAAVQAVDFDWFRAIFGRYDVLHAHWPELLMRDRTSWRRCAKRVLAAAMLARLRIARTRIIQTVHNIEPHEACSWYEARMLAALARRTQAWIKLNPLPIEMPSGTVVEILHGHYREWFQGSARPAPQAGRLLFFGLIRPYKQVTTLLDAFAELGDPSASLRIVGASSDVSVEERTAALAAQGLPITATFAFVPDEQLAVEVGLAELVVLPYREFYNSGAVLLALSLGRPVLTPRTRASEALASEFGSEWVLLYDGMLSATSLRAALDARRAHSPSSDLPDLSQREWPDISSAHAALYTGQFHSVPRQLESNRLLSMSRPGRTS